MRAAGPAEILRSSQKDDEFVQRLQRDVREIAQRLKGDEWWLRWHQQLDSAATYTYLLLTTVGGLQTLGEEYAGIVQVTGRRRLPGTLRRWLMVSLHVLGPALVACLVRRCDPPEGPPRLATILQLLHQLHTTLFYLGAAFYHPEKRLTGVRYLLVRPWMGDALSRRTFLLLGAISLLHLCLSGALRLRGIAAPTAADKASERAASEREAAGRTAEASGRTAEASGRTAEASGRTSEASGRTAEASGRTTEPAEPSEPTSEETPRHLQCPLCLSRRRVTAATPCGHLFCWSCAVDWLQTQPSCPVCREEAPPHRLVPLRGYDEG